MCQVLAHPSSLAPRHRSIHEYLCHAIPPDAFGTATARPSLPAAHPAGPACRQSAGWNGWMGGWPARALGLNEWRPCKRLPTDRPDRHGCPRPFSPHAHVRKHACQWQGRGLSGLRERRLRSQPGRCRVPEPEHLRAGGLLPGRHHQWLHGQDGAHLPAQPGGGLHAGQARGDGAGRLRPARP